MPARRFRNAARFRFERTERAHGDIFIYAPNRCSPTRARLLLNRLRTVPVAHNSSRKGSRVLLLNIYKYVYFWVPRIAIKSSLRREENGAETRHFNSLKTSSGIHAYLYDVRGHLKRYFVYNTASNQRQRRRGLYRKT